MFRQGRIIPAESEHLIGELSFELNDFRQQKVLYDAEAYGNLSKRLMLMRKGTFPSDPDMGISIDSYRFHDLDMLAGGELKEIIRDQHQRYIPQLAIEDIKISTLNYGGMWVLYIDIVCLSDIVREIDHAYAQVNKSLVSSNISVTRPALIHGGQ
jgi:hypothetical protein